MTHPDRKDSKDSSQIITQGLNDSKGVWNNFVRLNQQAKDLKDIHLANLIAIMAKQTQAAFDAGKLNQTQMEAIIKEYIKLAENLIKFKQATLNQDPQKYVAIAEDFSGRLDQFQQATIAASAGIGDSKRQLEYASHVIENGPSITKNTYEAYRDLGSSLVNDNAFRPNNSEQLQSIGLVSESARVATDFTKTPNATNALKVNVQCKKLSDKASKDQRFLRAASSTSYLLGLGCFICAVLAPFTFGASLIAGGLIGLVAGLAAGSGILLSVGGEFETRAIEKPSTEASSKTRELTNIGKLVTGTKALLEDAALQPASNIKAEAAQSKNDVELQPSLRSSSSPGSTKS